MPNHYRINEPDVSAEVFETEVLAINLATGHYPSLREAAVPLWRLILEGRTVEESASLLAAALGAAPAGVLSDAASLAQSLIERQVLVPASAPLTAPAEPTWLADFKPPYVSPAFDTYTDMQDLLLIDPIHEVDVSGWPHQPASKQADNA